MEAPTLIITGGGLHSQISMKATRFAQPIEAKTVIPRAFGPILLVGIFSEYL